MMLILRKFFTAATLLLLLQCRVGASFAAETDNFTGRFKELAALRDSTAVLDRVVNERLENSVAEANRTGSCDPRTLYLKVWNSVGRNPIGEIEDFAEKSPEIHSYLVDFKDGIYGSVPHFPQTSWIPKPADLFFITGWFAGTIRLNGQIVGIDKLGHFFGQGWEYFHTGSLKAALQLGIQEETGMDGYVGSGVYSYGDLSANIEGLRFWRDLLGGERPYIRCEAGRFAKVRNFSWKDYVTPAWDEALNCSKYVSAEMTQAIASRLHERGLACPIAPKACEQMVRTPCAQFTVNPICFDSLKVDVKKTSTECAALMKTETWDSGRSGLTSTDQFLIGLDSMAGIAGMSVHYLRRDARLRQRTHVTP